jgi:hypothetical protein
MNIDENTTVEFWLLNGWLCAKAWIFSMGFARIVIEQAIANTCHAFFTMGSFLLGISEQAAELNESQFL